MKMTKKLVSLVAQAMLDTGVTAEEILSDDKNFELGIGLCVRQAIEKDEEALRLFQIRVLDDIFLTFVFDDDFKGVIWDFLQAQAGRTPNMKLGEIETIGGKSVEWKYSQINDLMTLKDVVGMVKDRAQFYIA